MKFLIPIAVLAIGANALYVNSGAPESSERLVLRAANFSTCRTELTDGFEFPHLIMPVSSAAPDTVFGRSFDGEVSDTVSSLFNFDIPPGGNLKACSLIFHFPSTQKQPPQYYTFRGDGRVRFGKLEAPATLSTSFKNTPRMREDYGVFKLQPGHTYTIANFECPMGEKIGFQMSNSGSTTLKYFQNYGGAPFGLFITRCTGQ